MSTAAFASSISEHDRQRLSEALRRLLSHGSILGMEGSQMDLYHWCHQNRDLTESVASLLDLKLHWDHQERTVQAIPQGSSFLLRLKLDATLVLLVLWYEFDTAVRDRGETPPVRITVQHLNDSLSAKFEPLRKHLPSASRLREILAMAQRKNLLRYTVDSAFERSRIEIMPTLKRVIPFQDIQEWTKNAERYVAAAEEPAEAETEESESADLEGALGGEQRGPEPRAVGIPTPDLSPSLGKERGDNAARPGGNGDSTKEEA